MPTSTAQSNSSASGSGILSTLYDWASSSSPSSSSSSSSLSSSRTKPTRAAPLSALYAKTSTPANSASSATRQTKISDHLRVTKPTTSPQASLGKATASSTAMPKSSAAPAAKAATATAKGKTSTTTRQKLSRTRSSPAVPSAANSTTISNPPSATTPPSATEQPQHAQKQQAAVTPPPALSAAQHALVQELAQHGIVPAQKVMSQVFDKMQSSGLPISVSSFLSALAQLAQSPSRPASPVVVEGENGDGGPRTPPEPLRLSIPTAPPVTAVAPTKAGSTSFSTLESPSTPSSALRPAFEFTSPSPPRPGSLASSRLASPPPSLLHAPTLLPPIADVFLPATPRTARLAAFSTVRTPPRRPGMRTTRSENDTTAGRSYATRSSMAIGGVPEASASSASIFADYKAHNQSAGNGNMVAAHLPNLGRVVLSRALLAEQLGVEGAKEAIEKASTEHPQASLTFGFSDKSSTSTMAANMDVDLFGPRTTTKRDVPFTRLEPASNAARRRTGGGGKGGAFLVDERLGLVKSWLESDDEEEEEDSRISGDERPQAETWFAAAAVAARAGRGDEEDEVELRRLKSERMLEGEVEYVDVEDDDEEVEAAVEPTLERQTRSGGRGKTRGNQNFKGKEKEKEPPRVEIRVGGKNIRTLVRTKRQRLQEDEEAEMGHAEDSEDSEDDQDDSGAAVADGDVDEMDLDDASGDKNESRRSNGLTRAAGDIVDCICGRGQQRGDDENAEPMIRCDECRVWLHLSCLNIPSSRRLPKRWQCFRCTDSEAPVAKRVRIDDVATAAPLKQPSTPVLSHQQEPTLVASSLSPRLSQNSFFYRAGAPDMALAPSPQSSPVRRHRTVAVPHSPVASPAAPVALSSSMTVPIPSTPKLNPPSRAADYSPRSPLFYRGGGGRVRNASGVYEDGTGVGGGMWVSSWDGHVFGTSHGYYEEHFLPSSASTTNDDDDLLDSGFAALEDRRGQSTPASAWHDLTKTPSRTVSASFGWEATPSRSRLMMHPTPASATVTSALQHGTPRTASQDFLSALHHDDDGTTGGGGHSRAPSYAQRLFGSPAPSLRTTHQPPPMSPFARRSSNGRRRDPSAPFGITLSSLSTGQQQQAPINFLSAGPHHVRRASNNTASPHQQQHFYSSKYDLPADPYSTHYPTPSRHANEASPTAMAMGRGAAASLDDLLSL